MNNKLPISNNMGYMFLRRLISLLSPSGHSACLSIVIYHRVLLEPDRLLGGREDKASFELHLSYLTRYFNVLSLPDAILGLRRGTLPSRALCITFDDGYADNAEVALPILKQYGVPATFFIAAGCINGGRMWNDSVIEFVRRVPGDSLDLTSIGLGNYAIGSLMQRRQTLFSLLSTLKYLPLEVRQSQVDKMCALLPIHLPDDLMMSSSQIRALHSAGMEIGGHTMNHPILARIKNNMARSEIAEGKERLEGIIRAPVKFFAYPNGKPGQDYQLDHVNIVKELGFSAAVSTAWGVAKRGDDQYQLPRFTPWDRKQHYFLLRMARNMFKPVKTV
ncbi:Peptidoglycan/xylan/chitin deacetylase, PgdA/CDA1 family [Nitrosomonas cryotolerans]|uniref:Peptidoglycan/xylan/chitin deacetylase, PgdA/CDA1 family n=1 Tax=Nitrosomonas cryotolerans ATCC 49181 TaxID=1131553 RepID=A0A1N6I3Y7_9PROT|nr:polysaccharide deacetylase family protein [Nitrosomonas cryotolerans]SFP59555.1 Peptidoglycan/xylan/chitin deacetylase, PgdA/CDA1 family [Nitrosomonas cryotolerans]SIO26738.1 Peptidoglycan/xylan/chitin deacetylase, PgdA/CDA1 family [Nitrosomonas cryotolerans ATCC 49181]